MSILDQERFTEPEGWAFGEFVREGRHIRFGSVFPEGTPKAIIIILPGLGEYCEKYFETARNLLDQGLAVFVIDWMGQGGSGRYLNNPLKRHGANFEEDVLDFEYLIKEYVYPKTRPTLDWRIPIIMLGHSMGGNIGLRYLITHPGRFACAAFTAPMLGIHDLRYMPVWLQYALSFGLKLSAGESFTSGRGDFSKEQRKVFKGNELSSDPERFTLHAAWFEQKAELEIGDVTYEWVYHAIRSINYVLDNIEMIEIPCLFAMAGQEKIVDNAAILGTASKIKSAELLEIEQAKHEILMENDQIRTSFLDRFYSMINEMVLQRSDRLKQN